MTPKEKAGELRNKMYLKIPTVYDPTGLAHYPIAKEMALIAVDEILDIVKHIDVDSEDYWQEVKQEIINL
jgi:hypothetical protein